MSRQLTLHLHLPSYGTEDRSRDCRVCTSRGMFGQRHNHFSTNYLRQRCISAGKNMMECPVCQSLHTTAIAANRRVKAFFSSSTNNGFWKDKSWTGTDGYHVDCEHVGGMTLRKGNRIWRNLYDNLPMNIDTHLTVGINDVLELTMMAENESLNEEERLAEKVRILMSRVRSFYNTTQQHAHRMKLDSKNRFSLSTLLRAPQMYELPGDPKRPWPTHNSLLDAINSAIDDFNQEVRSEHNEILGGYGKLPVVPGMDMWGIRRNSRRRMEHVLNHFRERDEDRMLHLIPKKQARAAGRVIKYFKLCTPNPLASQLPPPPYESRPAESEPNEETAADHSAEQAAEPSVVQMEEPSAEPVTEPCAEPARDPCVEPAEGTVGKPLLMVDSVMVSK